MRIIVIGDQHKDINNLKKILEYCYFNDLADCYIQVGDLGLVDDFEQFLDELNWQLKIQSKDFYFIEGNHDNHKFLRANIKDKYKPVKLKSHIYYLPRGSVLTFKNSKWFFCGGGYSLNRYLLEKNKNYWPEETITRQEVDDIKNYYKELNNIDYFISHDTIEPFVKKLSSEPLWVNKIIHKKDFIHRSNLAELVNFVKPNNIIHGHFHTNKIQTINGIKNISLASNNQPIKEQIYMVEID